MEDMTMLYEVKVKLSENQKKESFSGFSSARDNFS